jgi:hypothetical protein
MGLTFSLKKFWENKNRIYLQRGPWGEVSLGEVSLNRLSTRDGWKVSYSLGTKEKMLKRLEA